MAKLNRIRIVLAEHDLNNKWLADKLGKNQATISKWVTNTTKKSIIDLIEADASISIDQMAVKMAVKKRTLEREIAKMKQKGYISRTGSPRSGKWEVIIPYNCVIEIE